MTARVERVHASPEAQRHVQREIERLGPWFHNLHLPGGITTAPDHALGDFPNVKWLRLAACLPQDLRGQTALDIGCNAGFYSFELARRGARVVALDIDDHYLAQARWAAGQLGLERSIEFRKGSVYDLARWPEQFDLILFMGVFYHLRHPLLALDLVATKVKSLLVFQTLTMAGEEVYRAPENIELMEREPLDAAGWPKMAFIEHRLAGDPTNWWVANHAGVLAMLRTSGLQVEQQPGHELYLCTPARERDRIDQGLVQRELGAIFAR